MRKLLFFALAFVVLSAMSLFSVGCSGTKPEAADSVAVDTVCQKTDTVAPDTMPSNPFDEIIASTPMPKAADELFDDFIFNFMVKNDVQFDRIEFPLEFDDNGEQKLVQRHDWIQEHFWHNDLYTLILDNLGQLKAAKDTAINHAVVERFYIEEELAQQYEFNRIDGQWKMTSMRHTDIEENKNASFLKFYQQFVTDSVFRNQSMAETVSYYGPDPENDSRHIKGTLPMEVWESFAPDLPSGVVYNVIYGQESKSGNQKIFDLRMPASSLEAQLTFKLVDGEWQLTKVSL